MRNLLTISILLILLTEACERSKIRKEEILVLDEIFTHENSGAEDKKMGFSIFPYPDHLPSDWSRPAKYKSGEIHFRVSVISKPDNRLVYYQTGFQWEGGCEGNLLKEKFPGRDLIPFTSPGIYTASQSLPSFWEPECQEKDPINWSVPMDRILVVLMDEHFNPIDNRWGYGDNIDNLEGYFPMMVHLQVVAVPEGGSFSGWDNYSITAP